MCGIIGIISKKEVVNRLVSGLKRLEYRGYDSAGIAVKSKCDEKKIIRVRAKGKISNLEEATKSENPSGNIGIGHTRWATHGVPTIINAHPHISENIAVVHNGIIENFLEIRKELEQEGVEFVRISSKIMLRFLSLGL